MSNLIFQWHLTNRCNQRCKHCYQQEYNGEELSTTEALSVIDEYKKLLYKYNELRNKNLKGRINITGGEPFVRKDIWKIIEKLYENRDYFEFGILTNGTYLSEEIVEKLKRYNPAMIQVSLDGKKETHDYLRGEGSYERTIKALKLLKKYDIKGIVSFTANNLNYKEFPKVVSAARKGKAYKIWTDRLVEYEKNTEVRTLNEIETVEYINMIKKEQESLKSKINKTKIAGERALQFLSGNNDIYSCNAGDGLIVLLPDGDVMPCRRISLIGGNIKNDTLDNIYFNSKVFNDLREPRILKGCENCNFKFSCKGGAKCISYSIYGTYNKADFGCILKK